MTGAALAEVLEAMPLPAFATDGEERILAANAPARAVLGEAAMGRKLALSIRAPELLEAVAAMQPGAAPREVALRLSDDGRWRARIAPRAAGGAICVLQDITAEAQAEAIRREFVANVSHELRTPLTALIGFLETLRGPAREDAAARDRFLARMEEEAGRMNRLVRDLLHLSRVEAEERSRPRAAVDLAAVLRQAAATLRGAAEERGSTIALSGAEAPVMLPGDADQLLQVALNLIENALKYGARGQEVRVTLARDGATLRLAVADRGEGIEATHLPRLTERFYRVDTHRSRAEGGTGLGLAIVKHIVARHRGRLEIDSRRGEGSVFSVILPAE